MLLTFAYYHILIAINRSIAYSQLISQNSFDQQLVHDVIAELLSNDLLATYAEKQTGTTYYKLTDLGQTCLENYERENPALIIR